MPAVSVIILVYKAEKYIEQCARSLFEQTLDDIEYIFVDDCTPDASMDIIRRILDDYPARRCQVTILRNNINRGQAFCRRRGIEAATGEYIIHCDSDDWPEPDMYARMYTKALKEKLDMVICAMRRIFPDHVERVPGVINTQDLLGSILSQDIYHYLLNKLIVREAYGAPLYWPKGNMCEDSALIIQLAYYCHRWGIIDDELYNYRYVPDSISSSKDTIEKIEQIRANVDSGISFLTAHGLDRRYRNAIIHLKYWVKSMARILPREKYKAIFPEINVPLLFDSSFTLAQRLGHLSKLMGIQGVSKPFMRLI